jgi:preprotein translocase subunit YajC
MSIVLLLIGGSPDGAPQNPFVVFVPYLMVLAIFYFILIRPQQRRAAEHQKFLAAIKKGDDVITDSGMFGSVVSVDDDTVVLKVGENMKVRMLKSKVLTSQGAVERAKATASK